MGILDTLFGGNTTKATNNATQAANTGLASTAGSNAQELTNTTTAAGGLATQGAQNATDALNSGYSAGTGALANYAGQAQGQLASGVNNAVSTIQGSNDNFQPYATTGTAATGALDNALGLNGAAGNAAAQSAFTSAPGYQYTLDQSTGAAQRAAAASGMSASGNTLTAVSQLGSNLANQNFQQYLTNLQNAGAQGLTAAQGISGNNTAAGSAQLTGATTGAGLSQQTGTTMGALDAAQGTTGAQIQSNLGNLLSGQQESLGTNSVANNWSGTNGIAANSLADAKAQDTATSQNNGIFSKALGSFFAPEVSAASKGVQGLLSSATGGFL